MTTIYPEDCAPDEVYELRCHFKRWIGVRNDLEDCEPWQLLGLDKPENSIACDDDVSDLVLLTPDEPSEPPTTGRWEPSEWLKTEDASEEKKSQLKKDRDDSGAPYEVTGLPYEIVSYVDLAVRRDLTETTNEQDLDDLVAAFNVGDLELAQDLGKPFGIYVHREDDDE